MRKGLLLAVAFFCLVSVIGADEARAFEVRLNVPWISQLDIPNGLGTDWARSMNCGPAALVMSAAYLKDFSPGADDIKKVDDWLVQKGFIESVEQYNLPEPGTGQIELRKAAGDLFGFRNTRYFSTKFWGLDKDTQLRLIAYSLKMNYPVIVGVKSRMDPSGQHHWMVLTGLREMSDHSDEICVNDPGTDMEKSYGKKWYPVSLFKSVWWGSIFLFDVDPSILAENRNARPFTPSPDQDQRGSPYRFTETRPEPGNPSNSYIHSGSAP